MDTTVHKRVLGIVHIVTGILTLVLFLFGSLIFQMLLPFIEEEIYREGGSAGAFIFELISRSITAVIAVIILLIPLPSVIGGIAIMNGKKWGFVPLMISGCLQIFSVPIGTAIGIYTIWVYVEDTKVKADVPD